MPRMVGERHEALAEAHHLFKLHRDGTEFVHRSGNVIFEVAVATEVEAGPIHPGRN